MRVLLISHTCQSRTEGQPKARCLSKMPGIELRTVVPDRWKHYGVWRKPDAVPEEEFDCTVGKVMWPWVGPAQYYAHWYPELGSLMREFQPDVIDLWEEPWGLVSAHACWLRDRSLPAAKIVTETEQNINKNLPFPFERFRSYTLSRANYAVGRNKEAAENLRLKGYAGPAEVVPNAVDTELFRPMDRARSRAKYGFHGFVAGYVGRLVEEKGLADMLAALPSCTEEINMVFVGAGPFEARLRLLTEELKVSHRVGFLPARPLQELPEIMNGIDALVLPSRTTATWKEQFGRVIIEAQACGTAVAGSNSGAIPEVIGEGGLVFAERNPQELANALCRLNASADERVAMGKRGRQAVLEMYTWKRVAERMVSIYSQALEKGG